MCASVSASVWWLREKPVTEGRPCRELPYSRNLKSISSPLHCYDLVIATSPACWRSPLGYPRRVKSVPLLISRASWPSPEPRQSLLSRRDLVSSREGGDPFSSCPAHTPAPPLRPPGH